ncbi:11346_t:CDS:2 [Paraglomus brasilianum]|uniref:11346_t:CDS:1 n=1 Tax=Paraglomus brasilianum TaxID=144538 RepID=A0A9N9CV40_9GLOM|nr:11346_t:CDS:2 [Paraglomus brasilianum]
MDKRSTALKAIKVSTSKRRIYKLKCPARQLPAINDLSIAKKEIQSYVARANERESSYTLLSQQLDPQFAGVGRTGKHTKGLNKARDKKLLGDYSENEKKLQRSASRQGTPKPFQSISAAKNNPTTFKKRKRSTDVTNDDSPKLRQKEQTPIEQFYKYCESYWRPFKEEDRAFLETKSDSNELYIIPPLGRHYREVWTALLPQIPNDNDVRNEIRNHDEQNTSEQLSSQGLNCRQLVQRLMSTMVSDKVNVDLEHVIPSTEKEINGHLSPEGNGDNFECSISDSRLEEELRYLGVLNKDEKIDWEAREDDAICAELRKTQEDCLKEDAQNTYRRQNLIKRFIAAMAYQQCSDFMEELDNQVEECFVARFVKDKKIKKKRLVVTTEDIAHSLDRRKKYKKGIEVLFDPSVGSIPKEPVFNDEDMAEFVKKMKEEHRRL